MQLVGCGEVEEDGAANGDDPSQVTPPDPGPDPSPDPAPPPNGAPSASAGPDRAVTTGEQVTLRGNGSDPDGDPLSFRWYLVGQPSGAGAGATMSGVFQQSMTFTPNLDGIYKFQLVANDGTDSSPADDVSITSEPGPNDPPVVPPPGEPAAGTFAPTIVQLEDHFDNAVVRDADVYEGFWLADAGGSVNVSEANGRLSLSASGIDGGGILSSPSEEFNFFLQPLRFSVSGIQISGSQANAANYYARFALTSSADSARNSADAFAVTIGGDGRVVLSWKTGVPGADTEDEHVLLDQTIPAVPTRVTLTLDQTSYRLVLSLPSGDVDYQGTHSIPMQGWGDDGSSALSLEIGNRTGQASGAVVAVSMDAFEVVSLKLFDGFSDGDVEDAGFGTSFWQSVGADVNAVVESNGEAVMSARGGSDAPGVVSPVTGSFNFFAQQLKFVGSMGFADAAAPLGSKLVRFGLTSERSSTWDAASALAFSINANNRVRLGWKTDRPGAMAESENALVDAFIPQTPTTFELAMTKSNYTLVLRWNGGSQQFTGQHELHWYDWSSTGNAAISLEGEVTSASSTETVDAYWDYVEVTRDDDYYIAPTVFAPVGDGINLEVPPLDRAVQDLADWGFVDVTKPPFNADPTGLMDSTQAIQRAMTFARENYMVTFFPPGEYRVSDTLSCAQSLIRRTDALLLNDREGPCVLMGSRAGANRPRLFLAPFSPGFDDPANPKYVVHFWARSYFQTPEDPQPNISFNQMFVNLDIEVGPGNAGAIGIRHRGAQGSAIQETTIDVSNGFAGIDGASGSGGSQADITVVGGQYGLYLAEAQAAPTIAGITLIDQERSAIQYGGLQALSAVGVRIVVPSYATGPAIKVQARGAQRGQLSLVDSSIEFAQPGSSNAAISTDSSVYLKNVYFENANRVLETTDGDVVNGPGSGWSWIREYANGIRPPPYGVSGGVYQYEAPVYLDGVRNTTTLNQAGANGTAPPADLVSRHLWPSDFPSWESPGAVNVKLPPYSAVGDGYADDTAALQQAIDENEIVFLPKGYYRVSQPLVLGRNTKLIGTSKTLTVLLAARGAGAFSSATNPQPIVRTVDDASADTILAFLDVRAQVDSPGAYALLWRAGADSIFRAVNTTRFSEYGYAYAPGKKLPPDSSNPLVVVTGNGGGKWYNFNQGGADYVAPVYRHILIDGTSRPLRFYQFNPEHARTEANAEVRGASNVDFYGVKGEGNYPVLWIRDSNNVSVYGYGGNAVAFEASYQFPPNFAQFMPSLFRIERTPNVRLTQLVDEPRVSGDHPVFGVGVDPNLWHMLLEVTPSGLQVYTEVLDRPVLYKRGNPP